MQELQPEYEDGEWQCPEGDFSDENPVAVDSHIAVEHPQERSD